MGRASDLVFKTFTAGLGIATVYLTVTLSINVYRGFAWHNAQSVWSVSCSHVFQAAAYINTGI